MISARGIHVDDSNTRTITSDPATERREAPELLSPRSRSLPPLKFNACGRALRSDDDGVERVHSRGIARSGGRRYLRDSCR